MWENRQLEVASLLSLKTNILLHCSGLHGLMISNRLMEKSDTINIINYVFMALLTTLFKVSGFVISVSQIKCRRASSKHANRNLNM